MNTILRNGASVCTPDNFAVEVRKLRTKRMLKNNLKKHCIMNLERVTLVSRIVKLFK